MFLVTHINNIVVEYIMMGMKEKIFYNIEKNS